MVSSVVKWREFRGNKKNCYNSDLLSKTEQDWNDLDRSLTGKKPFFSNFNRPDFLTDLKGCQQTATFRTTAHTAKM